MLNTPPDFKFDEVSRDCKELSERSESFGALDCDQQEELLNYQGRDSSPLEDSSQLAIVEVAKLAVEVKKLDATATVEVERLRQHGATARVKISEENKTQRSACVAAMVKRVVEEHNQTEREKIAAQAQAQQASIAAEVKKAELEAQRPRQFSSFWLLLLLYLDRSRLKMRRVALAGVFFMLLRRALSLPLSGSASSGPFAGTRWNELWRGISTLLQRRNLIGDVLSQGQPRMPLALPFAPLPPFDEASTGGQTASASAGDFGPMDKDARMVKSSR
eukprot:Skav234151  [mRNA]  locus=scaffold2592:182413:186225:+ [translate_table: standard]